MNQNESGYLIYQKDTPKLEFYFNKTIGRNHIEIGQNINTTQFILNNFGKYPFVYVAGNMNYKTFDLTGVFLERLNEDGIKIQTANEYAQQFINLVNQNKPFVLENSRNEKMLCHIQLKSVSSPMLYYENDMEYVTVNITCTEIGSA